jgi:glycosyl transferase, family 25
MAFATYLINLDRDPDRLKHMAAEFAREGLAFTRIPAVLGLAMPDWVRPCFLDDRGQIASTLKVGEVGCYASHLVAARRLLDEGHDCALICEDDLILPLGLAALIEDALVKLPAGWDILRLSNPEKAPWQVHSQLANGSDLSIYARVPNNTGAHLLSRSGAQKLLAEGLRDLQIDEHLRRPWLFKATSPGMETFGIVPMPIQSNIFDSTIDQIGHRGLATQTFWAKLRRRRIGNLREWLAQARWQLSHLGLRGWIEAVAISAAHSVAKAVLPSRAERLRAAFRRERRP